MSVLLGVFFLPQISKAATIYQQLSDSSGEVTLSTLCSYGFATKLATFNPAVTSVLTSESFYYGVFSTVEVTNNDLGIYITEVGGPAILYNFTADVPSSGEDAFMEVPYLNGSTQLVATTTYEVWGCASTGGVIKTRSNLSHDFSYGYITDDGTESVPVAPGIPGFTDVGIATTSQQIYCAANFATSSGLLDNIGQSFALGICNVGVFLFIPSQGSVNTFFTHMNTLQTGKFPFTWITQTRGILEGFTASSSGNYINLSLNFGTTTSVLGLSTVEIISTTTLSKYLSDSTRNAIKLLISALFFLLAIAYIYRDIQSMWNQPSRDAGGI